MPIKINELVIRVKVVETSKKTENLSHSPAPMLLHTEQQKLALTKDFLNLWDEREAR